ncbi:efflux RND transporter periplasmic adaptor subunit [Rhizobium sp. P38BS-XIX]|uniref:efflux RND transporter periplasmic adaptor subunit n=1 Tax=Rhizobium sp. P38BS-XIX TaxID=2726740 RepID=UPI001456D7BD|nr:efflux RND transporter periplasmic adaptor subunit [Rhizobium sp. P38BS-XIX]NLR99306.1 efflux RND transporter periplasmic adaptor subunit [Rhizobium sp. P38BS-XIX]
MTTHKTLLLRSSLLAAGLLFFCASPSFAQQAGQMPPPQVTVVDVKPQTVALSYEYAARISAFRQVDVRARVGGILLKRNFVEGAEVKAGDVLFLIDPATYKAALAQAQAQLQQSQAQLTQTQREEKRNVTLFQQNAATQKARDDAISARELAEAAVAAAQAQVQTAQLNLDYTQVTAPVGGITSLEQVSEGSLIGTTGDSGLLTSITQLDPVYVNFSFSDAEAAEVRRLIDMKKAKGEAPNLGVKISFGDGSSYDHDGVVDFTSSTIDVSTGTLQARAVVDNPDRRLLPGQFVRAKVTGVSLDNAITIPEVALMQSPQGQFVYTIDQDGKAHVNPVTLGQKIGSSWLVLSGLKAGDKLITEGIIKVRPGAPVQATADATPKDAKKVAQN